jgi:hypothetical protein
MSLTLPGKEPRTVALVQVFFFSVTYGAISTRVYKNSVGTGVLLLFQYLWRNYHDSAT